MWSYQTVKYTQTTTEYEYDDEGRVIKQTTTTSEWYVAPTYPTSITWTWPNTTGSNYITTGSDTGTWTVHNYPKAEDDSDDEE